MTHRLDGVEESLGTSAESLRERYITIEIYKPPAAFQPLQLCYHNCILEWGSHKSSKQRRRRRQQQQQKQQQQQQQQQQQKKTQLWAFLCVYGPVIVFCLHQSNTIYSTLFYLTQAFPSTSNVEDVKALNSHSFTTTSDIPIDMETEKVVVGGGGGAEGVRGHSCRRKCHNPSHVDINTTIPSGREYAQCVLLVAATLLATMTYQAAFILSGGGLPSHDQNRTLQLKKPDSITLTQWLTFFNCTSSIVTVTVTLFLLHEFPLKPWSTLFGAYMCLIMAISPAQAWPPLILPLPFLVLAAAATLHGSARDRAACHLHH